jgi:hypothetical protein
MRIEKQHTVQELFNQFNDTFPFLKLEFYAHGHDTQKGSPVSDQLPHTMSLAELNPHMADKVLQIVDSMTVSEFENLLKDTLNLNVQVFRKSNDVWLQTTATDHWTLEKQNGKGERSTKDYDIEPIDITDFDVE